MFKAKNKDGWLKKVFCLYLIDNQIYENYYVAINVCILEFIALAIGFLWTMMCAVGIFFEKNKTSSFVKGCFIIGL